jgi:hypothetical protein
MRSSVAKHAHISCSHSSSRDGREQKTEEERLPRRGDRRFLAPSRSGRARHFDRAADGNGRGRYQRRCRSSDPSAPARRHVEARGSPASSLRSGGPAELGRSAVRGHDLSEMTTALEMAIGFLRLGKGECPVDHGAQTMQRDGPVHSLEIGAAADADRPDRNAAPCYAIRDRASSPMATGSRRSG